MRRERQRWTRSTRASHIRAHDHYKRTGAVPYLLRSPEQIGGFFDGLAIAPPGLVPIPRWRPDPTPFEAPAAAEVGTLGGVGRKTS